MFHRFISRKLENVICLGRSSDLFRFRMPSHPRVGQWLSKILKLYRGTHSSGSVQAFHLIPF